MKKKISVFTGTRAEYGLLFHLMKEIQAHKSFELQTIVSGAHLSTEFGNTWRSIETDGFQITSKVDMLLSSDSSEGITKSMGIGMIGMADAIKKNKPDLLVILGDRYEALVAAQSAMIAGIPIAHLHGGESSEGAIDESIRHSITKMSHLHFTAANEYRNKVIQLGEQPSSVWSVGATGLDNIQKLKKLRKNQISKKLNIDLKGPIFVVTYHPVTLENKDSSHKLQQLLDILNTYKGSIIITGANADTGNNSLRKICQDFSKKNPVSTTYKESLGVNLYLNLLRYADVVVGNSSSGLIEAPSIGVPTVNIGKRQMGRLCAPSVINAKESNKSINAAITLALSNRHKRLSKLKKTPYGEPGAAKKIIDILLKTNFDNLLQKKFFYINNR